MATPPVKPLNPFETENVVEGGPEPGEPEEHVDENREGAEEDAEGRAVQGARAPRQPSPEEREAHYRSGHYPRRNWCSICVQACCVSSPHVSSGSSSSSSAPDYPTISLGYCYPGATKEAENARKLKAQDAYEKQQQPIEEDVPPGLQTHNSFT